VRALAIQLVIFIHCLVNSADAADFKADDNPGIQQKKDGIVKSLVQIGIPMFFYISGIASSYFNTEGRGFTLFFVDKVLRLILPFFAAIFIFLVPRLYFG
jgi:surface polysaccharide O-acyltransferase-like enzyme